MKVLTFLLLMLIPAGLINAQRIGEIAPEKAPEIFPSNSWGADIMFGEGGFGLGTFLRKSFSQEITGFVDLSFSESKDEREIEYIDYFGNTYTFNKKNSVYLVPINFGIQYRLFSETLTDNLRPYINAGIGPTIIVVTPYELDFFSSFGKAQARYAAGGYIGLGANFGLSKSNLAGINIRYYYTHILGDGVEILYNRTRNNFGSFYLTLNLGIMY